MNEILNKFGGAMKAVVTIVVTVFIFTRAIAVFDAVRYPYMGLIIFSFIAGVLLTSNRWIMKGGSLLGLFIIAMVAGSNPNDPDVQQVFVFVPYLLGVASQFLIGLRINLLDKANASHDRES